MKIKALLNETDKFLPLTVKTITSFNYLSLWTKLTILFFGVLEAVPD